MRHALSMLMILWASAVYAASPVPVEIYAEVDHALSPAAVLADPVGYHGRILLLGGVVVRTVSDAAGVSLEIDCYRLANDDRPEVPAPALGRVVAAGPDLDGARLQPGRLVTLVGQVTGWTETANGQRPRLEVRFLHPWPTAAEEAAARAADRGWPYDPWCDPWRYDRWCDPWYYGPYPYWRFGAGYYGHRH